MANDPFSVLHDVVVGGPCHLHFSMPKLGKVAPCSGFLRPEGWCDGVEAFKRRHGRFRIELPRLGEVGLLSKIGNFKQGGTSFDRTCHKVGCLVFQEIMAPEIAVNRSESRTSEFEHGRRPCCSEVEVTMVEGVLGPSVGELAIFIFHEHVCFRDGEGTFGVHRSNHFNSGDVQFVAPIGSFVDANRTVKDHTRFNDQAFEDLKHIISEGLTLPNALDGPCGITKHDEADFVATSCSFYPSFEFNRCVVMHSFLHITYPCRLDHARTVQRQPACLCECLPCGACKTVSERRHIGQSVKSEEDDFQPWVKQPFTL